MEILNSHSFIIQYKRDYRASSKIFIIISTNLYIDPRIMWISTLFPQIKLDQYLVFYIVRIVFKPVRIQQFPE